MNLSLMPYRLNTDFNEVADQVTYIDSYNGAKLYKVNYPELIPTDIPITDIHLYFLEEKLITVYLHLENNVDHIETVVKALALELGLEGALSRSQFGLKYKWEIDNEVLVLVKDQIHWKFYIYYASRRYSVY
jgi:hypothetical protein